MSPLELTIAIPVYERTDFFEQALLSAIHQTIPCQVIVVDNNSSHNRFQEIIAKQSGSTQIKYFRNQENLGMVGNWNRCIDLAQSEFLTILHDDDVLHPEFVETVTAIEVFGNILFSKSKVGEDVMVDETFLPISRKNLSKRLSKVSVNTFAFGNFNYVPGTVFRKSISKEIGGFSTEYGYILDFHFWLRLCLHGDAYFLNEYLSFYRYSANQGTKTLYRNMVKNTYELLNLVPSFRLNKFIRYWSCFRVYSGGMDLYRLEGEIKTLESDFADTPSFILDHNRFHSIYNIPILKKTIIWIINKFVDLSLTKQIFLNKS